MPEAKDQQGKEKSGRQGKRPKLFKVLLKDGFHTENDQNGVPTLFERGDVFMANRPLHTKWPEKFSAADEYTPLKGGAMKVTGLNEDRDEDQYWEDDPYWQEGTQPAPHTVPTVPLQKAGEQQKQASRPGMPGNPIDQHEQRPVQQEEQGRQGLKEMPDEFNDEETMKHRTVKELKEHAHDNEIDLEGATTKDEIIQAILKHKEDQSPS